MKKYITGMALITAIVIAAGCTVGRKMSYENKQIDAGYASYKTMAVVFHDQRKEVLNGREKPTFCGHTNSGMQIAYNIQTATGKPLAEEFTDAVTSSLSKKSIHTEPILINHLSPSDSAMTVFKNGGMERLLLFSINEWESVAQPKFSTILYEVFYNFDLKVYDKEGNILSSGNVHDVWRKEDASLASSMKRLQQYSDSVFVNQMRNLLLAESVKASLQ